MKSRILGAIGVVWGAGILLSGIVDEVHGEGISALGEIAGLGLGLALFGVGLYYVARKQRYFTYLE